ncbi:MAG: hypothetical protein COX96_05020 [Candidatus Omnitrophica bacterium CG_4_10_14_0_2_um_filter_44_9]|nr:MAG: hypothetical protein COY78_08750 [Candidatus Omnitrophica bacterium CG_4_10_14_0_8_um_filter_44_12]PIZ84210.1 MAG: hypothetical protein COX96_05020 [Candidatus Omnitrophica bacterium CG_4_10_14_0_2_um_filter_44_9]
MEILFITSILIIAYTYFGYPLLLMVFSALLVNPVKKKDITPMVSIIVSAYNEEKNIESKVANLLELDYPRDKMEIIVGSDGSTDETYRIIKKLAEENKIRYAVSFQRAGKPAMINKMTKDARGEIFIFADARQKFDRAAVKELVKCFGDANVGAVSGELIIQDKDTGTGCGIGMYWEYEKLLRNMESSIGSMLGATGAIYAIRKDLFRYLPGNVILDDIFTPMNSIMAHKRAIFEPAARAYDVVAETTGKEFTRKVRTLVGNFQIFGLFPEAFDPFKSPIAFQLFSHKFLRLFVFYLLVLAFVSNIFILNRGAIFVLALFLQVIFYIAAFLGYLLEKSGAKLSGASRAFFIPYEFCALNLAAVAALRLHLSGGMPVTWEK